MELKDNQKKAIYYSRYIPALKEEADGGRSDYLSMYASSDGETYDESVDSMSVDYIETSANFRIKLYEEMFELAMSGGEADVSDELSSFIKRVRANASEKFLKEFPHE